MEIRICPECNYPLTWISQYQRWYCTKEKMYPELPLCPFCEQPLHWIPQYQRWYCYEDTRYLPLPPPIPIPSQPENSESPLELKNSQSHLEYMSKIEKAKWMREHPEPAEERMWQILNSNVTPHFPEHPFYSQDLQYGYILDFYCPTLKLAIEIDGGSHNDRVGYDWERDTNLENRGIRTLRATNEQVLNNPHGLVDSLCKIIQDKIAEQENESNIRDSRARDRERYRRRY
jgi:very-short-patch-repair endonuclease